MTDRHDRSPIESSLDRTIDLKRYFQRLARRRGIIVLCTLTTLCATAIALTYVPKEYESTVTLMIEDRQLLSNELEKLMGGIAQQQGAYGADEERMSKLMGRIQSRPFLERVIRILKMQEDPAVRARADEMRKSHREVDTDEMAVRMLVGNLQSRIRFSRSGKGVYKVTVADYSPQNAQLLAKWMSELFVDVSNRSAIDRLKTAHDFGTEQLSIYEQQLSRSEETLEQYKKSLIERSLTQSVVRTENLGSADALLRRIEDEAAAARVRINANARTLADRGLSTDEVAVNEDPEVRDLASSLAAALQTDLRDRLTRGAGDVGDLASGSSYGMLRRDLLGKIETVAARSRAAATSKDLSVIARSVFSRCDLEAQLAAGAMLRSAITDFRRQVESTPKREIELTRLENEVETNRKLLQSFQAQLVASDVSQAVELTKLGLQIEILDPASLPLAPSRPNRTKILLASIFLGPLLGVGLAFLSETLDPTLRSLEEFARIFPEPILGTTPLLTRLTTFRRPWIRRHWVPATLGGVIVLTLAILAVRSTVVHDLLVKSAPVRMVNPEQGIDENSR
jgi:uncharacterized protein involved in exopolysaccharide biosynthesis